MATELICPKCQGAMRSYERNRVTIDQCVDCRGIFLDRGELERLIDAEAAYNQTPQDARPAPPVQSGYGYPESRQGGHHGGWEGGHNKRRKGFLGDLFD